MDFFQRFEELAKSIGSSPNAVAKELGLSSGSVTAWKNGTEPSVKAVTKIADYFGVSVDYSLGRDIAMNQKEKEETMRLTKVELQILEFVKENHGTNGTAIKESIGMDCQHILNRLCNVSFISIFDTSSQTIAGQTITLGKYAITEKGEQFLKEERARNGEIDESILSDKNIQRLISFLYDFDDEINRDEFVMRSRKLARDMKAELLNELSDAAKERGAQ